MYVWKIIRVFLYECWIVCVLYCVGDVDYVRTEWKIDLLELCVYSGAVCFIHQKTPSSSYCVLLLASAVECERIDYSKRCYIIFAVEGIFSFYFILYFIQQNINGEGESSSIREYGTPTHINASADTKWGGKCRWGCENCVLYSFCYIFFIFFILPFSVYAMLFRESWLGGEREEM